MPSRNELNLRARVLGIDPAGYANDSKLEQKILWAEKRATTFSGTLATGTLTTTNTFSDGEKIVIGDVTYTMKTTLSEVKATAVFTATDVMADGETITVNGYTYTFKTALSDPVQANEVLIGANLAASLDNLKLAINKGSGIGTNYSYGTVANPYVTATTNTNTEQTVEARQFGTEANSWFVSETTANGSWGASTLTGGVANVPYEVLIGAAAANSLDNLKVAINKGSTEGTNYSTGTAAHPLVTATTNADDSQVVQAVNYSVTNADIATTTTAANATWGAATLESGVAKVVAEAAATTKNTSAGVAGDENV